MFEYVSLSFSPFGTIREINGLDGFLRFLDYFSAKKTELFFPKISLDLIDGVQFLHNNWIAQEDLKPANILESNKHYAKITDAVELNIAIKNNSMQFKLTYFGKLRSLIHQTRTVLAIRTNHKQRGVLIILAPEQLPGKYHIKEVKQEN